MNFVGKQDWLYVLVRNELSESELSLVTQIDPIGRFGCSNLICYYSCYEFVNGIGFWLLVSVVCGWIDLFIYL